MKAKRRLLVAVLLLMVITYSAYMVSSNYNFDNFNRLKEVKYHPNYIDVSYEKVDSTNEVDQSVDVNQEETKEPVEENTEEEVVEADPIVYDNMTMEELSNKINLSLNSTIAGKGNLIASYSLEKGVDPYMATAIILHETGCSWECSYLVKTCNNVGGQKGSGCGNYSAFNSLDEGIMAFIDNLYNNYVSLGLTTPELINPKYAQDQGWSKNVNKYIEIIRAQ